MSKNLPPLVLASTSFRRQELMRYLGLPFEISQPDFDERAIPPEEFDSIHQYVETIGYGKAMSVAEKHPEATILTGDTMVLLDDQIIGKPDDLDHARQIITQMAGRKHLIVTGVTIVSPLLERPQVFSVESWVEFKQLTPQEIDWYISTSESLGKAGAYALQENARKLVKNIEGSVSNVIGYPIEEIAQRLTDIGYQVAPGLEKRLTALELNNYDNKNFYLKQRYNRY